MAARTKLFILIARAEHWLGANPWRQVAAMLAFAAVTVAWAASLLALTPGLA